MLTPAITLRRKLDAGETVIGVMATDHAWPLLVEICQRGGLDYLVIDREHGPHSDETIAHVCEVGRLAGFPVLMRTASTSEADVRRALDLGPCGLVLPGVDTGRQLDEVRDAIYLPPRGRRRPGGMGNYWLEDYHADTWRNEFEEHFLVIPQIESMRGVENADAIASHEIVTALGLGP